MSRERRVALAELLFEHYYPRLPSGAPLPEREEWPEGFIEKMADTPPVRDLDAKIAAAVEGLARRDTAAWQGFTS